MDIPSILINVFFYYKDVKWEPVDHLALPVNWQNQGFYRFPYTHSHTEDLVCSVTGVPMGSSLVIHGNFQNTCALAYLFALYRRVMFSIICGAFFFLYVIVD